MKIAVVGTGGVGAFYGARLAQSGQELWCLARSDYDVVKARGGYWINDHFHHLPRTLVPVNLAKSPEEIGCCDLVFVALKTTANDNYERLIRPLVGENTLIVPAQNGLGNVEALAKLFGREKIIGAITYCTLVRIAPGEIETFGRTDLWLAEVSGGPRERTFALAKIFENAGLPTCVKDSLDEILWKKLCWNIPFNGLCVAYNMNCGEMLADPEREACAWRLLEETQAAARVCGVAIPREHLEEQMDYTKKYCAQYLPSTLLDLRAGRALEVESIWGEPLRRGNAAGLPLPELSKLYKKLKQLSEKI
ncbi:MAG: 2-dehydropantoate 2-reductase [Opitutales bacterium]|nr:2-dehydropantoate 2-reductase [Opitutales bacterium]